MGGGKCQLCMKESAAIERTWRGQSRVIRHGGMGTGGYPWPWQETQGTGDKLYVF